MLIVKYTRKDFFGCFQYTEDSKANYKKDDIKKAFLLLSREHNAAVQKDNIIYSWDSITDFENRIVMVRKYDTANCRSYTDEKKAFELAKKECYSTVQQDNIA